MTQPNSLHTLAHDLLDAAHDLQQLRDLLPHIAPPHDFDLHTILPPWLYPPSAPARPEILDTHAHWLLCDLHLAVTHQTPLTPSVFQTSPTQLPASIPFSNAQPNSLSITFRAPFKSSSDKDPNLPIPAFQSVYAHNWVPFENRWIFLGNLLNLIPQHNLRGEDLNLLLRSAILHLRDGHTPRYNTLIQQLAISNPDTFFQTHFAPELAELLTQKAIPPLPLHEAIPTILPNADTTPFQNDPLHPPTSQQLQHLFSLIHQPTDLNNPNHTLLWLAKHSYAFPSDRYDPFALLQHSQPLSLASTIALTTSSIPTLQPLWVTLEPSAAATEDHPDPLPPQPTGPFIFHDNAWRLLPIPSALATHRTTRLLMAGDPEALQPTSHTHTPSLRSLTLHIHTIQQHLFMEETTPPISPTPTHLLFPTLPPHLQLDNSPQTLTEFLTQRSEDGEIHSRTEWVTPNHPLDIPRLYAQHLKNTDTHLALSFQTLTTETQPTTPPSLWVFYNQQWTFLGVIPKTLHSNTTLPPTHPIFNPDPDILPTLWKTLAFDACTQPHTFQKTHAILTDRTHTSAFFNTHFTQPDEATNTFLDTIHINDFKRALFPETPALPTQAYALPFTDPQHNHLLNDTPLSLTQPTSLFTLFTCDPLSLQPHMIFLTIAYIQGAWRFLTHPDRLNHLFVVSALPFVPPQTRFLLDAARAKHS